MFNKYPVVSDKYPLVTTYWILFIILNKNICAETNRTNGLEGEYEDDVSELQLGDIILGLNAAGRNGRFFCCPGIMI